MTSKKLRLILLGALGMMALAFVFIAVAGTSMLAKKSQKMVDMKIESKTLEAQLSNLAQAKKEVQEYSYFKDVAKTVLPSDKDQAQAVLEIVRLANESGISLQSITFPSSSLGAAPAAAIPPTTGSSGTAATPAPTAAVISQAKPVTGIKGLYSLELTISPDVSPQLPPERQVTYDKMLDFLKRIERNRRTAQITEVTISPNATAGSKIINFSLKINIFIKP